MSQVVLALSPCPSRLSDQNLFLGEFATDVSLMVSAVSHAMNVHSSAFGTLRAVANSNTIFTFGRSSYLLLNGTATIFLLLMTAW
jgi:hypothetical protein